MAHEAAMRGHIGSIQLLKEAETGTLEVNEEEISITFFPSHPRFQLTVQYLLA